MERTTHAWHGLEDLRPLLRNYLARRCRDESETDDVVQETLLRAARYRGGLTDTSRLRAWILQIARNVLRDHVRREGRLPRGESCEEVFERVEGREPGPGEIPDELQLVADGEVIEREIALTHLHGAMRQLRFEDRAVLHSYYSSDGSSSHAARACAISPTLVKVRLFRARQRLLRAMLVGLATRTRLDVARVRRDMARSGEARLPGASDGRAGAIDRRGVRGAVAISEGTRRAAAISEAEERCVSAVGG